MTGSRYDIYSEIVVREIIALNAVDDAILIRLRSIAMMAFSRMARSGTR